MNYTIGMSVPSVIRESVDSLLLQNITDPAQETAV